MSSLALYLLQSFHSFPLDDHTGWKALAPQSSDMPGVLPAPSGPSPKVNISSGPLPAYISASQAPTKKSPWRTIREVDYVKRATATLPEELYHIIWRDVEASMSRLNYAKVIMKLEDMLQGDFFNEYIKRGKAFDILARSSSSGQAVSTTFGLPH